MFRSRLVALIAAVMLVTAIGGAAAFAGDKSGAVNVTNDCGILQVNTFPLDGGIYVWLHNPSATGYTWEIAWKGDSTTSGALTLYGCTLKNWTLYSTGASASGSGTITIFDANDKVVGGDSWNVK